MNWLKHPLAFGWRMLVANTLLSFRPRASAIVFNSAGPQRPERVLGPGSLCAKGGAKLSRAVLEQTNDYFRHFQNSISGRRCQYGCLLPGISDAGSVRRTLVRQHQGMPRALLWIRG